MPMTAATTGGEWNGRIVQDNEAPGAVTGIPDPRTITGWVRHLTRAGGRQQLVTIHETASGLRIGKALVDAAGQEPGSPCPFEARLRRPVTAAELREGQVVVRLRVPGGAEQDLAVAALAETPLAETIPAAPPAEPAPEPPPEPVAPPLATAELAPPEAAAEAGPPPVRSIRRMPGDFLHYCRQQGITFRSAGNHAHSDLALEAPCVLSATVIGRQVAIGGFTGIFGQLNGSIAHARVGRFCSIADGFTIGPEELPSDFLSTSALQFEPGRNHWNRLAEATPRRAPVAAFAQPGQTEIGHDVWVGANVFIRRGVRVGHGAILAAGAVVVADVPPYAVVGGVPASVIRYRFDADMVERLLALQWWNYNVQAVPELRFDIIEEAVSLLEDKLAAGALLPLPVRPTTLGELHATWTAQAEPGHPRSGPRRPR